MTGKELLDKIGEANPELVEAAGQKSVGNRRKKWVEQRNLLLRKRQNRAKQVL